MALLVKKERRTMSNESSPRQSSSPSNSFLDDIIDGCLQCGAFISVRQRRAIGRCWVMSTVDGLAIAAMAAMAAVKIKDDLIFFAGKCRSKSGDGRA